MGHMGHASSIQWVTWVMGHSKWSIAYSGLDQNKCVFSAQRNCPRDRSNWRSGSCSTNVVRQLQTHGRGDEYRYVGLRTRQQWRVGSHPSNTVQQDHAVPWKQARPTYKLNSLADWKLMELPEIWSDSHVLETGNRTEPNSNTMLSEFPARNAWEADVSQV